MLFEPCGDLLKDYGAYCETLRVTEREEVYSAIRTRMVPRPQMRSTKPDAGGEGEDGRTGLTSSKAARPAKGAAAKEKTTGRRRSSRKGSNDAPASAATPAATAATAATPDEATAALPPPPPLPDVSLTSVVLHFPVFCLNQRDMAPLCRAIPHCPSLMSVELHGCGLSMQSYMRLVEAVYRSPRVLSVAVDFNCPPTTLSGQAQRGWVLSRDNAERGFVTDPTVHAPTASLLGLIDESITRAWRASDAGGAVAANAAASHRPGASARSPDQVFGSSMAAAPPQMSESAADSRSSKSDPMAGSSAGTTQQLAGGGNAGKASTIPARPTSKRMSRLSQISNPDAAAAAGMDAGAQGLIGLAEVVDAGQGNDEDGSSVMYFYPTQYCGLDQQPTPLELQLQEEKEKKGKADAKKVQQLLAQRDTLRAFDQQHRIPVPKTWDGILFTGIHHLSLRGNRIDDAAAARLAQVLIDNPRSRLMTLNLWGNEITDTGASALARMLRGNYVLRVLDLGSNQLGDAGLLELLDTLRMRQLTSPEEVLSLRKAHLTRQGATEEERRAANQPLVLADIPSYEDLYTHWWHTQQQAKQDGFSAEGSPIKLDTPLRAVAHALLPPSFPAPPPPPQRDASPGPSLAGSAKRTPPTKSKSIKSDSIPGAAASAAAAPPTSSVSRVTMRHTVGFDKDCVRVRHIAENDPAVRVPGNTVLEVLNLEENRHITVAGVREAARRLGLHEPVRAMEMLAMLKGPEASSPLPSALSSPPGAAPLSDGSSTAGRRAPAAGGHRGNAPSSAASTMSVSQSYSGGGVTVIHPPELHCAGLRLRSCTVRSHREAQRSAWPEMDAAQEVLNAALLFWAAPSAGT